MTAANNRRLRVFISYKWQDDLHNGWVEKFAADLRQHGIETILDKWYVRYGDSFIDYMTSMIGIADIVLFVMTKDSVTAVEAKSGGGAVKFKMQLAKTRSIAGEKMRLIGVLREGDSVPAHLRDRRYADFRRDSDYESRLRDLIDDLLGLTNTPEVLTEKAHAGGVRQSVFLPAGEILHTGDKVYDHFGSFLGELLSINPDEVFIKTDMPPGVKRIRRDSPQFRGLTGAR